MKCFVIRTLWGQDFHENQKCWKRKNCFLAFTSFNGKIPNSVSLRSLLLLRLTWCWKLLIYHKYTKIISF